MSYSAQGAPLGAGFETYAHRIGRTGRFGKKVEEKNSRHLFANNILFFFSKIGYRHYHFG